MEECIHCPAEVKTRLAELKLTRNQQKNQLKAGYHKIFIDRLWERLHGPPLTSDDDDEEDTSWEADHLVSIYHVSDMPLLLLNILLVTTTRAHT